MCVWYVCGAYVCVACVCVYMCVQCEFVVCVWCVCGTYMCVCVCDVFVVYVCVVCLWHTYVRAVCGMCVCGVWCVFVVYVFAHVYPSVHSCMPVTRRLHAFVFSFLFCSHDDSLHTRLVLCLPLSKLSPQPGILEEILCPWGSQPLN